jgi:hypothetical protein
VSFISAHLALSVTWSTDITLNSDHLPICITFIDDQPPPRTTRTFVNFKRVKWGLFTSETERLFADLQRPTSCSTGEQLFRRVLSRAFKHHIPAGYRKDFQPGLSREAIDLTKFRDRLRELDPLDPEIPNLNQLITDTISNEHEKLWREKVESSNPRDNPDKHWRLIRILSGKRPHQPPNQPIHFGNKCFSKPQEIARKFCQQFTSVGPHKTDRNSCRVIKSLKKKASVGSLF